MLDSDKYFPERLPAGVALAGDAPSPAASYEASEVLRDASEANTRGDAAYYAGEWSAAEQHFEAAALRVRDGAPSEARDRLRALIHRNLGLLGLLRGDRGVFDANMVDAEAIIDALRGEARWYLACDHAIAKSYVARHDGDFERAVEVLAGVPRPRAVNARRYRDLRVSIEEANVWRNLGLFDEAITSLEGFLERTSGHPNAPDWPRETTEVHKMLGYHYLGVAQVERAVFLRDRTIAQAAERNLLSSMTLATSGHRLYEIRNRKAMGWLRYCLGDCDAALDSARSVCRDAEAVGDVKTWCLGYVLRGAALVARGSVTEGTSDLAVALKLATQDGYWKGQLFAHFFQAQAACSLGEGDVLAAARSSLLALGGGFRSKLVHLCFDTLASGSGGSPVSVPDLAREDLDLEGRIEAAHEALAPLLERRRDDPENEGLIELVRRGFERLRALQREEAEARSREFRRRYIPTPDEGVGILERVERFLERHEDTPPPTDPAAQGGDDEAA